MESTSADSHLMDESAINSVGDKPIMPWVKLLDNISSSKVDPEDLTLVQPTCTIGSNLLCPPGSGGNTWSITAILRFHVRLCFSEYSISGL
jgi:hypothetical protein